MSYDIGKTLAQQKKSKSALNIFLEILKINPKDLKTNFQIGKIYFELNNLKKSISYFEKCNDIQPNNLNILTNLAITYQYLGKIEKSKKIYLKIISIDPKNIKSYFGLYFLNIKNITFKFYQNLEKFINEKKISLNEKCMINFIFSKFEKKDNNLQKEIEYLKNYHNLCYEANIQFNEQSDFYYNKIISNHYNKIEFKENYETNTTFNELNHIFIIGLPRSGSTLVETIISHNETDIISVGELHGINTSILKQIGKVIYDKDFKFENFKVCIDRKVFQESLIERYDNFEKKLYLDKSLENFFNIEIILEFFPNAKFLHTHRNINDAIIAIYQSMLPELSWSHKIETIKNYVNIYQTVMNYFKKKYPDKILDIKLENLTDNKEYETKRILNFCKIKFNENYLDFSKNEKLYNKTNSFLQVREKINIYDDKKYKPYYFLLDKI